MVGLFLVFPSDHATRCKNSLQRIGRLKNYLEFRYLLKVAYLVCSISLCPSSHQINSRWIEGPMAAETTTGTQYIQGIQPVAATNTSIIATIKIHRFDSPCMYKSTFP